MSKDALLTSVDEIVDNLFSSPDAYKTVKTDAITAYDKYRDENNLDEDFGLFYDFIFEYVMKSSVRMSMQQMVNLLCDSGLLNAAE